MICISYAPDDKHFMQDTHFTGRLILSDNVCGYEITSGCLVMRGLCLRSRNKLFVWTFCTHLKMVLYK